ncbi:hypothetical protein ABPG72_011421 [Tetrahymena utriculariae]
MKKLNLIISILILLGFAQEIQGSLLQINKERENIENALETFKKTKNIYKSKQFKGETFAFLTPWNKQGFERALKFKHKFTYLSPVWFEIKDQGDYQKFDGEHNIDENFLSQIRELNKDNSTNIKILPRIYLSEEQTLINFKDMWARQKVLDQIAKYIDKFDGFVLDSVFLSYFQATRQYDQIAFVRELSQLIKDKHNKLFFVCLLGKQDRFKWKQSHMVVLLDLVDRLLVSAYDYHQIIDGYYPINPISWIQENINFFDQKHRPKILIGMPFYGFRISSRVDYIMGEEFKKLIEEKEIDSVQWVDTFKECVFRASDEESVRYYYPCLKFIDERLKLFEQENIAGTYIWELGQGQDILLEPF